MDWCMYVYMYVLVFTHRGSAGKHTDATDRMDGKAHVNVACGEYKPIEILFVLGIFQPVISLSKPQQFLFQVSKIMPSSWVLIILAEG